jgi:hypothetical protein
MKNAFKSFVGDFESILILLPKDPIFDQVAAGLSLYLSLSSGRKEVSVVSPSPMLVEFNRLVGVDRVSNEVGNKNLVVKFNGYDAQSVERITSDVEGGELYLRVIPKPRVLPPKREQVEFSYAGVNCDLAILVGGTHERHYPMLSGEDIQKLKLAHVGVEGIEMPQSREVVSFAKPASSVSEVVAGLVKELVEEFDQDIASNLLMGMYEGSKSFSSPQVTHETFQVAGELMKAGGRHVAETRVGQARPMVPGMGGVGMMPMAPVGPMQMPVGRPVLEKPGVESTNPNPPAAWMQAPKVYKGNSLS